MRSMVHVPGVYAYVGTLPRGCSLCLRGVKLVVFVTGLCDENCFYCPVSRSKLGRDVVFADEEPARSIADVVEEAERIGAEGASITGGDPLIALERTVKLVRLLKEYGGPGFHVHLYTSGRYATLDALHELERAGLDEVRFHPVQPWMVRAVEKALRVRRRMSVGVEVPVLPDRVEELKRLIAFLDRVGAEFVNLNELEAAPDNIDQLTARGYRVKGYTVEGSYEAGLELVRWSLENTRRISVHLCPARYKDAVQMRARLVRKALRTGYCFEEVRGDGSLRTAVARVDEVPGRLLEDCCWAELGRGLVALHPRCLEGVGVRYAVVEVQPRSDRLAAVARLAEAELGGEPVA